MSSWPSSVRHYLVKQNLTIESFFIIFHQPLNHSNKTVMYLDNTKPYYLKQECNLDVACEVFDCYRHIKSFALRITKQNKAKKIK
jgi:hypothetical protein